MPFYSPLDGGDRRSAWPHYWPTPTTAQARYEMQQKYRGTPWADEPEPDDVKAKHETRSREWGGWTWHRSGVLRPNDDRYGQIANAIDASLAKRDAPAPLPAPVQRQPESEPPVAATPRAEPTELESTAGHEAAHHCLASICGCTDIESTIEPSRSEAGAIRYGHCAYCPPAGGLSLVKDLAISAAGGVWEMLEYGRYINGPDGATVARKLDKAGITDPDERAELIDAAHKYARRNLETNRDSVRQLAQELQGNMRKPVTLRRVQMPLQTRSGAATFDSKANTVSVIWGTGARVLRNGWDGKYWEDLPVENADLEFLNSGRAPFLNSHNMERVSDVLGVVTAGSAYTRDGKGYATIKLGTNAPRADLESGVLANVSIGYRVNQMRELPAGADGVPIMRIEAYKIQEISLVGIGADSGAQVRTYEAEVRGC